MNAIRKIKSLTERHDWWESSATRGNLLDFETTRRAVTDDVLESWYELVASIRRDSRTQTQCTRCIVEMMKEHCGEKAHEHYVKCMRNTKKPEDMKIDQFIKYPDNTSTSLTRLKEGGTSFSVEEMSNQVTQKVFPGIIVVDYLNRVLEHSQQKVKSRKFCED